jgi:hypothetical protein
VSPRRPSQKASRLLLGSPCPPWVQNANLVAAPVTLGERPGEPVDRVERLVDIAHLVEDPE